MAIFVVIAQPQTKLDELEKAINTAFSDAFKLDGRAGWLISAPSTAQNLAEQLGVVSGENGSAIVLEVTSYFGRANPNTWTWLKEKLEAARNG